MSAVDSALKAGTSVKNFAIGAAILVGVVAAFYFGKKITAALGAVVDTTKQAGGYLLGTSNDSSLGTDLYGWLNPQQQLATAGTEARDIQDCNNEIAATGHWITQKCKPLADAGKLNT